MEKKIILGSILFSICTLAIAQTALPPALYIKADDINSALESQPASEKTWLWAPSTMVMTTAST